jgi:hypothetical protein
LPAVRGPDETIEIAAGDDEHVTPIGAGPDVLRLQIADRIRLVSGERDENIGDEVLGRRKGCQRAADPRLDRRISVSGVLITVVRRCIGGEARPQSRPVARIEREGVAIADRSNCLLVSQSIEFSH